MAANSSYSAIRARADMTPRTFDISGNQFSGVFPTWLVAAVGDCKENVTVVLDVGSNPFAPLAFSITVIRCLLIHFFSACSTPTKGTSAGSTSARQITYMMVKSTSQNLQS
jgi:hypothetical protein